MWQRINKINVMKQNYNNKETWEVLIVYLILLAIVIGAATLL
jgi:hypothetical protein